EGGVAHVAARSSELSGTRVHDKGLRHLCGLKKLCELNLSCAPVTDAAIDDIVALPALERIVLTFTGLTANGLAELRARRPKLDVRYWEQEDSDVTFDLVRAGLWAQALEKAGIRQARLLSMQDRLDVWRVPCGIRPARPSGSGLYQGP